MSPSILIIVAERDFSETLPWVKDLEAPGYSCIRLSSRSAQMNHVQRSKMDLVLLDSTIADEFNGETDVYDKLGDIPAVHIVSPDALSRAKAFAAGAADCIVKPIVAVELLTRVRTQLALRALQKQLDLRNIQFVTTLENIGQGVCFFDAQQRLIL